MQHTNPKLEMLLPASGWHILHVDTDFDAVASDILSILEGLSSHDCILAYNTYTNDDRALDVSECLVKAEVNSDGSASDHNFILMIPSKYINIRFSSNTQHPYTLGYDGYLQSYLPGSTTSINVVDGSQGHHGSYDLLVYPNDFYLKLFKV